MPVVFRTNDGPRHGGGWRSRDFMLTRASNETFVPMTGLDGRGLCATCRIGQPGTAWGSNNYVLCTTCAMTLFQAPDLRAVMPQIFLPQYEEDGDDETVPLTTKRDKDFIPTNYRTYIHTQPLSGRHGCAGYKCETYSAPERTIPANTQFMLGSSDRGHLCMHCFDKLRTQFYAAPPRIYCSSCERRIRTGYSQDTVMEGQVCNRCIAGHFIPTPATDNGWVRRDTAAWITTSDGNQVYASERWAAAHWFQGAHRWFATEEERDAELYAADTAYRDQRIASHIGHRIFSYGTNIIKMHGFPTITKRNDLCFGVELEMQPNDNHTQEQVVAILGGKFVSERPYILCADSSLGAAGVEMITLPYTLANHKSDKYVQWTKILGDLRKVAKSGQNTTSCGMHVHINRKALSHLQMGKMLVVINAPEMQELIVTIAQRSETSYARRFYKKVTEGGKIIGGHGDALNMSNQKGTVELRIFRGNLRYERVMKNLEFAEALCLYAAQQSIQKVADPAEMLSWINDNKAHYPHLVKFLREEYRPTRAFARRAALYRKSGTDWESVPSYVLVEPTEGDI